MQNSLQKKNLKRLAICIIGVFCVLLAIRRIIIGVHIDEESMLTVGYRFIKGEHLFTEVQEPQILLSPIIGAIEYLWLLLHGSAEYIVIYMRVITALISLFCAFYIYKVLKKYIEEWKACTIAIIYNFYCFRHLNTIDYTFLAITASVLCVLVCMNYKHSEHKNLNMTAASTWFCLMAVCFPSTVLLYPFYLYAYYRQAGKKSIVIISLTCLLWAIAELTLMFNGHNIAEIPQLIQNLIGGSQYGKNLADKSGKLYILAISLFCAILLEKFPRVLEALRSRVADNVYINRGGQWVSYALLLFGICELLLHNSFRLEYYNCSGLRLVFIFGAIQLLFYKYEKWYAAAFLWGIAFDCLVDLMTRWGTGFSYGLLTLLVVIAILLSDISSHRMITPAVSIIAACALIYLEVFTHNLLMISNTNHYGDTIYNQDLQLISEGPAKGAFARVEDAEKYDEIYHWIRDNIDQEKKICYFGKNVLLYMMSENIDIAVPQVFMDYADDEALGRYYEQYPEKYPDMVIMDVSPTTKRLMNEKEEQLFADYTLIYKSANYVILEK